MVINSKEWRISIKKVNNSYVGKGLVIECYKIGGGIFGDSLGPVMYDNRNIKKSLNEYKKVKGIKGKNISIYLV